MTYQAANAVKKTALGEDLLHQIAEVLLASGVSPIDLRNTLQRVAARAARAYPVPPKDSAPYEWWVYARILTFWHQDADFIDAAGSPRPLSLAGKRPNFGTLVLKALPGGTPRRILRSLGTLGAIRRYSRGRYIPANRNLIVKQRNQMTLPRAVQMLEALVSTMNLNTVKGRSRTGGHGLFERAAVSERFDLRQLRNLDAMVRLHGQALLELIDEWLTRHEIKTLGRGSVGHVGVGIYLFANKKQLFDL